MINYNFNKDTGVLQANYIGDVTANEVVNYIRDTKNNTEYPRKLKIISDTRNAKFDFSIEELELIVEENYKSLEKYDEIIDAIIVDNPKKTVLTVLYKQFFKTKKYKFEIFATESAAKNWLHKW